MTTDGWRLDFAGDVAWLTLNRPAKRNAITLAMWQSLPALMAEIAATPSAKLAVIAGAGGHFAAGADISEFSQTFATPDSIAGFAASMGAAMESVATCPKPVIAQIEGACVGGGCGLALACDIRIAATGAKLGITPGKLGLAYTLADTKRLSDAVGFSQAKILLYTGRLVSAEEALALGLVDQVVPADALADTVRLLANEIAAASQTSSRITKATLALIAGGAVCDTAQTQGWFSEAAAGPDLTEGRAAFLAKRPPKFPMR
jgi:enoyl-CoA hydratase/carnithine racemase